MKRVLITGAGSYVGSSFERWVSQHHSEELSVDTVGTEHGEWRDVDPASYDAVFHVAGIAHADVDKSDKDTQALYYTVNRDLAIEVARWAKEGGIGQFVFMSTMIVYGDSAPCGRKRVVTAGEEPHPSNFYGDSKWQADIAVRALAGDEFKVAVLRPPMIYGPGSKGNYPKLANLARRLPVFPDVRNERSMLYVGNLCELVCQVMIANEGGVFFPQDSSPHSTSDVVREVARTSGHRIRVTKVLNWAPVLASRVPGKVGKLADKAFGSMSYDPNMSECGLDYRLFGFRESVARTEGAPDRPRRVLFLVNHDVVIYNFRLEIVERLLQEGYEVHVSSPYGERINDLVALGVVYHPIEMDRHSTNPLSEAKLMRAYRKLLRDVTPDVVLGFTIKPNVYGAMAARKHRTPFIANVSGLGKSIEDGGTLQTVALSLYKAAFKSVDRVFFQNSDNCNFMTSRGIVSGAYEVLPGSGVNTQQYSLADYPENKSRVCFVTLGRIMRDKGIDELLSAARIIRYRHPSVRFLLIGMFDDAYEATIANAVEEGIIEYIEPQRDVRPYIAGADALVHASWHEGMSNVCLEAASMGRPVIATNIPGCRETFLDGVTGIGFEPRNVESLVDALERFIALPWEERRSMGRAGREKVKREFDREIVVNRYMNVINEVARS